MTKDDFKTHEIVLVKINGDFQEAEIVTRYKNFCDVSSVEMVKNTDRKFIEAINQWTCEYNHKFTARCAYTDIRKKITRR